MPRLLGRTGSLTRALIIACSLMLSAALPGVAAAQPRTRVAIASPRSRTVEGTIRFAAMGLGWDVRAVEYVIDGHARWTTTRRPFRYRLHGLLNTRGLKNGRHLLKVIVFYRHRVARVIWRWIVVRNRPIVHKPQSPQPNKGSGAPPVIAVGSPLGGLPGPSVAFFNRETYHYSSSLSILAEANTYQVIVLQSTDGKLVAALHAANPNLKILVYQHPWFSKPTDPAGWTVCTSYSDNMANHPDWFLRDPAGNLIQTRGQGNVLMDLTNPAYQQACLANAVALAKRYGFDGVYLDDITASPQWDIPVGATVPKYPTLSSWQAAMSSLLSFMATGLHANGLLAYANLCGTVLTPGLWQQWNAPLDGVEEEEWVDTGAGLSAGLYFWAARLADAAWSEAHGKTVIIHSWNTTEAGNAFGLASMLLVAGGHTSYSTANGNYTSYEQFYPEYATAQQLGAPTGAYFKLANGVYERVFANGIVLVNPTRHSVPSFSLGGGAYSGSGLRAARTTAMAPMSGLVLVRIRLLSAAADAHGSVPPPKLSRRTTLLRVVMTR